MLTHLLLIFWLQFNAAQCFAVTKHIQQSLLLPYTCAKHHFSRRFLPGRGYQSNCDFTYFAFFTFFSVLITFWITILLLSQAGDVHPNPGPASNSSDSMSASSATSVLQASALSKHLSFIHYNVQSILPKLNILFTELCDFDILAFSESWLNASVPDEDLSFHFYHKPERKDRVGDSHGGVILYVKESLHYTRRRDIEPNGIECIWIEITLNHKRILFGLFYRPPSANAAYFSSIEDSIHLAIDTGIQDIIVTGDFNFNMSNEQLSVKVKDLCEQFSFEQVIEEPTHYTEHSSSLLDIILTNNTDHIILSGVGDPFLTQEVRYHCPVYAVLNFSKPKSKSFVRRTWSYDKGNYPLLREMASSIIWENLYDPDVNKHALNLSNQITSLAMECIPNRLTRIRPGEPYWINSGIKRLIRKRKRAYRKAKRSGILQHWNKFRNLRNEITKLIREAKESHKNNIANKLKTGSLSSRDWWRTLKSVISPSSKQSLPPLEHNGLSITEDAAKTNILNDFFRDQTLINDNGIELPDITPHSVHSQLSSLIVTPEEVKSVLKSLPVGKAAGPDGISNRVLRELSVELSNPFCSLFNCSLQTGVFPDTWKLSNVTPIDKGGNRSSPKNYRPVSLLCNPEKLFERVVFKHLYNHLNENQILTPLQSGFIPGDSTINQLTYLYNFFAQALDSGKEVRVVFCDISKAFDRVWHEGLLLKLEAAGISGNLLLWFRSYLTDRKQRVVLPGAESEWTYIRAGVPQGSILGPLLFLLFINDIVDEIGCHIRLFADDTSLYITVENPDMAAELLNIDLDKIMKWAKKWLVLFNPVETESFLASRKLIKPLHPPLFMEGSQIMEVESHKHLGIFFSHDCTWHKHINYIKEKAWKRVNAMRKLKFEFDRKSLQIIYFSFIRPILEYGDSIWDNCTQYEKSELDKIQNEAARIVTGCTKLVSIRNLNDETKWETLEERRKKHKLTLFYKMTHNLTPSFLSSLVPQPVHAASSYNLRNSNDIQNIPARSNYYHNSFLPSTVREWNNLPLDTRNSESLNSFKRKLNLGVSYAPKYYFTGNRKLQILHTRLRTKCSALNHDLFLKNITDSPLCQCGGIENAEHYFLSCPLYINQRYDLTNSISAYSNVSLQTILYGNNLLTCHANTAIFGAVEKYINDSKRF